MRSLPYFISFILFFQSIVTLAHDSPKKNPKIALSLVFKNDLWRVRFPNEEPLPTFVPYVVVWDGGHCLCGNVTDETKRPTEFFWGQLEPQELASLQRKIQVLFPLNSNVSVKDIGLDASYYILRFQLHNERFSIQT